MGERIRCRKCGDILQSKHRHDFQMCKCGSCYIDWIYVKFLDTKACNFYADISSIS